MSDGFTLSALPLGESAFVTHISARPDLACRLADLGLIPGTRVTCLLGGSSGDPRAYLIRGALIALRKTDAAGIRLRREASVP